MMTNEQAFNIIIYSHRLQLDPNQGNGSKGCATH